MTARALLFGDGTGDAGALRVAPSWHDLEASLGEQPGELSGIARETVSGELATTTADITDIDLGDMLIYGWSTHRRLVDAAKLTLQAPGRKEVVRLGSHRITSAHHPAIDLVVDGVRVHTFRFELTVTFDIDVAVAVIQQGKLVAMRSGDLSVTGTLEAQMPAGNAELAHGQRQISSHLVIRLGQGVPLVDLAKSQEPHAVAT